MDKKQNKEDKEDKVSLIVVGESSVGKTGFLNRYISCCNLF